MVKIKYIGVKNGNNKNSLLLKGKRFIDGQELTENEVEFINKYKTEEWIIENKMEEIKEEVKTEKVEEEQTEEVVEEKKTEGEE